MRYPELTVGVTSSHPLALIGAVRQALRRNGADEDEVARFSGEAFARARGVGEWRKEEGEGLRELCRSWVRLEVREAESRV